jgi:hypothetical protein
MPVCTPKAVYSLLGVRRSQSNFQLKSINTPAVKPFILPMDLSFSETSTDGSRFGDTDGALGTSFGGSLENRMYLLNEQVYQPLSKG